VLSAFYRRTESTENAIQCRRLSASKTGRPELPSVHRPRRSLSHFDTKPFVASGGNPPNGIRHGIRHGIRVCNSPVFNRLEQTQRYDIGMSTRENTALAASSTPLSGTKSLLSSRSHAASARSQVLSRLLRGQRVLRFGPSSSEKGVRSEVWTGGRGFTGPIFRASGTRWSPQPDVACKVPFGDANAHQRSDSDFPGSMGACRQENLRCKRDTRLEFWKFCYVVNAESLCRRLNNCIAFCSPLCYD
jgi:hypothetical protein